MDGLIRVFTNTQRGAPQLSGTAGTLLGVLRACLVDGYGAVAATAATVSGGIATIALPQGSSFDAGAIVRISGATPAALNGDARVISASSTQITVATTAPDGAASGAITVKMAPADWQEKFAGTVGNVGVFAPTVPEATGMLLRVDDTGATNARVRAWETMTDANTGQGPIPLDSQVSGGLWWGKSYQANSTGRPWWLIADARGFYLAVDPYSGGRFTIFYAGDIIGYAPAWDYLISGNTSDQTSSSGWQEGCCGYSYRGTSNNPFYLARLHTGMGGSVQAVRVGSHNNGTTTAYCGSSGYGIGTYPNAANNGLITGVLEVYVNNVLRGTLPGLLHPVQDCNGSGIATGAIVKCTDDLAGRSLLALRPGAPAPGGTFGLALFDITGPWGR